ncbi:MAG: hypothetical protein AAFX06_19495 [Planctomycetota bacterium]
MAPKRKSRPRKTLAEELQSKAKLYMMASVDLVRSKSIKKNGRENIADPWIVKFEHFYSTFIAMLENAYDQSLPSFCSRSPFTTAKTKRFKAYKVLGDELFFRAELTKHQQTITHAIALKTAVREFNRRRSIEPNLECKSAAWIAGVPITDSEIKIPGLDGADFIGPSIDKGINLADWAEPYRLTLSFDLALMMLRALIGPPTIQHSGLHFFYRGKKKLRNALNGILYPHVYVDIYDLKMTREEKLLGITSKTPCDEKELEAFLEEFRTQHDLWPWFIKSDPSDHYKGPTEYWVERFKEIRDKRQELNAIKDSVLVDNESALVAWREKLEYLQSQEPLTSDPEQKFVIKKKIEEASRMVAELS